MAVVLLNMETLRSTEARAPSLGGRWDGHGLLVVDAELEASGAPFDEVERSLGFQRGDGGVAVTGNNIATVEERDGHVLSIAGVADHHLVVGLEAPSRC
jgi:hypothetical protein